MSGLPRNIHAETRMKNMARKTSHDLTFTRDDGSKFTAECFVFARVEEGRTNCCYYAHCR